MGQVRRVSADRLARRSCRTGIRSDRHQFWPQLPLSALHPHPRTSVRSPSTRMLQSWLGWIRTTTAAVAGSFGTTATTLIGASAGTSWWPHSTTGTSSTPISRRERRGSVLARSAVKTSIPLNTYPGLCRSRGIDACSETLTYCGELWSTGSCLHASRTWTCPPASGLSEPSVFLHDVGPQRSPL